MDTSHEKAWDGTEEWLTPPGILEHLGTFDLDPCSPVGRPWATAKYHFTKLDDGLRKQWFGRVFCNPPYGKKTAIWLAKCSRYKNCIVLTFARTETKMFFEYVWNTADSIFFFKGRLRFYDLNGQKSDNSAGAPSLLISYNKENSEVLKKLRIAGKFIKL